MAISNKRRKVLLSVALLSALTLSAQSNIVDEVVWVVGDEPILKSDVEAQYLDAKMNNVQIDGDPYCTISEQLAVQKLYLHQAQVDSVTVSEAEILQSVEETLEKWIQMAGSKEKLEEYKSLPMKSIREQLMETFRNIKISQEVQRKIVKDVKVTPAQVRRFFKNMPEDSIPFIPTQVEIQIITQTPQVSRSERERVEADLRDYTERVNSGSSDFSTLALLYSEDTESARLGGDLGFQNRTAFVPEFSAVAFNLTDPKKVSKIVKTEYGYHIIQLIDKRGDKVRVRHILRKPQIQQSEVTATLLRMDSVATDIRKNTFTFDEATYHVSDDKDTKNNHGIMVKAISPIEVSSRFEMKDLPQEIATRVEKMKVGEVSDAFSMTNNKGQKVCAIIKVKNRIDGHKAIITEDYQVLKDVVLQKYNEDILNNWIKDKLKTTYVKIKEGWRNCDFKYSGWIK